MFEVWPRSKVWSRSLTSEVCFEVCLKSVISLKNCPKSVWSGLHDSDHHWSAVLLVLITYIKMYFLSLFGYICMFVFVVWQINCPSLWVRSLTSVRCLTTKATTRRLKYVRSTQSEVWKLMSQVHNRKSDVRSLTKSEAWCPTSMRKLSELCPKSEPGVQKRRSEVQSMSKVQNPSLKPKSEVCQLSKSETEVQSLTPKIWSWKSEVESLSEVRSKFFAIIITLSYITGIIYCVFVDQLWQ